MPDIRLFWSTDPRFTDQFKGGGIKKFKAFSKYPECYKDVSFWLNPEKPFHPNDLAEMVRGVAGDIIEEVKLIDEFSHPKTGKKSMAFRMNYRSMERSLTNEEVNALQDEVRGLLETKFCVTLR